MLAVDFEQRTQVVNIMNPQTTSKIAIKTGAENEVRKLMDDLSPDTPWGDRQIATKKLGCMRCPETVAGLSDALLVDSFWMVRCTIIQALEILGDPGAIPTLPEVANKDSYQVVRSYAAKAIRRLSS